jgi:hypothetical protein
MTMKSISHSILIGLLAWFSAGALIAQQTPHPFYRFVDPGMFSPSAAGGRQPHHLWMGMQQSGGGNAQTDDGWNVYSQFLNFNSGDLGLGKRIGWGLRISHLNHHTQRRVNFAPTFSAQVVETDRLKVGVGILLGFTNWGINASNALVAETGDFLLDNPTNHWDLDAGLGFNARYHLPWLQADAAFDCAQLPSNFLSQALPTHLQIDPYYNAAGGVLFNPIYNVWIGPRVMYRNILPADSLTGLPGGLSVGAQVKFERQALWFAAGYNWWSGHLIGGFGMQVLKPDTAAKSGFGLQIQGMGTYPVSGLSSQQLRNWGPTFEIGLSLLFARKTKDQLALVDSTHWAEDFWDNNAAITRHTIRQVGDAGPTSLVASTSVVRQHVALTYSFPDNSFLFLGEGGVIYKDSLIADLGEEWLGVDALLENLANRIIDEAFHPDSTNVRDPENLEPLKKLLSFQLSTHASFDERAMDFVAGESRYEGEIDTQNDIYDTLYVRVNYNGSDTTIGIPKGGFVTNLQLATLKLHAMRKKLEYELRKNHRHEFLFLWEGQVPTDEEINSGLPIVRIKTPRIIPNNPNQQADYRHEVTIRFERDKQYVKGSDEEEEEFWEDESDPAKAKSKRKHPKKAKKKKPAKEVKPTSLPEQFPTTEEEGTFEAAPEPEEQPEEEAPSQDLFDDGGGY